jgi:pimeloyl-ACP methyl ester carboxylesterase
MKKTVIIQFNSPLLGVLLGIGALIAQLQAPVALAAEQANECVSTNRYSIPVTLSTDDPTVYHIAGWLYSLGPAAGKTVQVVIHGATYDHNYFNFPYQPGNYSYVDYLIGAGYAVLDIDRIGSGLSDHPADPEEVTLVSGAYTIHQIVQGLRNGTIAGVKFEKVMLVGHSVGSAITLVETAIYNDVDGIILSAFASAQNPTGVAAIEAATVEADTQSEFATLPNGYETTKPGTRAALFYNVQDADPNVIALDEILKQTVTDGELEQLNSVLVTNTYSSQVKVPVLLANGSDDSVDSGAGMPFNGSDPASIRSFEAPFFTAAPSLSVFVLRNSGHDVNLHLNAPDWFAAARAWSDRYIGTQR